MCGCTRGCDPSAAGGPVTGPGVQLGCEAREGRGELIHQLDARDRAPIALGDKRVDDGTDPVALVGEEPLRELVAGHGPQGTARVC